MWALQGLLTLFLYCRLPKVKIKTAKLFHGLIALEDFNELLRQVLMLIHYKRRLLRRWIVLDLSRSHIQLAAEPATHPFNLERLKHAQVLLAGIILSVVHRMILIIEVVVDLFLDLGIFNV